jgi:hypothetical protein
VRHSSIICPDEWEGSLRHLSARLST